MLTWLAEIACEHGSDGVHHTARQAPPYRDRRRIARIHRIVLRDGAAGHEVILVGQRRGLEAPVLLEIEGPGAALAAAEIEQPHAALAGAPHHLPVLEVVGRRVPR